MRVFLFLLLTTAAAAQPIECSQDTGIHYDSEYKLVRINRPGVHGMMRKRIAFAALIDEDGRIGLERVEIPQ